MNLFSLFQPNSLPGFARQLMRELKLAGDPRECRFDESQVQLHFFQDGEDVGMANLQNLYQEYIQRPSSDRKGYVKQAVRSILSSHKQVPKEFVDACPDLLLTVRNRSFFTSLELQAWESGEPEFTWPHIAMAEHLGVGLVYDLPESMMMIHQDHLTRWNLTFFEAYEFALKNLSEIEATFGSIEDRLYISDTNDNFDASRILMTDWIQQLKVDGDPIVMVPTRDRLLVTGSSDAKGLRLMAQLTEDSLHLPRAINGIAYRLSSDDYFPWLPETNDDLFLSFRQLRSDSIASEYEVQKAMLDQTQAENAHPTFVASYNVLPNTLRSKFCSYCIWSEGVDALLPKTDAIAFARESILNTEEIPQRYSWDIVHQVLQSKMFEQPLYPPRYRVLEFPTEEELEKIRVLAQNADV